MTVASPFIPTAGDIRPFSAEIWLIGGVAANLIVPFFSRRPNFACAVMTLVALLLALLSLLTLSGITPGPHLGGLLLFDSTACVWKIILLSFVCGIVFLWMGHSGRSLRQGDGPEFFVLLLGATLGMCLMASTTHLLMIVLAIAMASLPSYLLAGFRKHSRIGAEASLKYVLFGAVSSAIMVYGISFIYGLYGTLQLTGLPQAIPQAGIAALSVAMIALLIGVGFKACAVPMHFWCPDVFEGSAIEVTSFLSVASKGAALVLLLRLVQSLNSAHFAAVVGLIGALTATIGNTAAFTQTNIKRLLAYSSIAQAGYMICLISAARGYGNASADSVAQALLLYLAIYALMNLGSFSVVAVVNRENGEQLENYAGLGSSSPLVAGSFFCCLISLIGLPPFAGFGVKLNILWVLAHGGAFGAMLVVVIVLNTVLSAFYYFRVIRVMYLQPANDRSRTRRLFARDPVGVLLGSVCAGILILLFFAFGPLYSVTSVKPTRPPALSVSSPIGLWFGSPGRSSDAKAVVLRLSAEPQ